MAHADGVQVATCCKRRSPLECRPYVSTQAQTNPVPSAALPAKCRHQRLLAHVALHPDPVFHLCARVCVCAWHGHVCVCVCFVVRGCTFWLFVRDLPCTRPVGRRRISHQPTRSQQCSSFGFLHANHILDHTHKQTRTNTHTHTHTHTHAHTRTKIVLLTTPTNKQSLLASRFTDPTPVA